MENPKRRWSGRAFLSVNLVLSLAVLILSSVVLYIVPPGRDAYWTGWRLWGLDKDQWGALHTVGGLGFLVFGLLHLTIYNWRAFWGYVRSRARKHLNRKAELAAALVLNVLIFVFCVANWFPVSTIMNWGASLKDSWVSSELRSPLPHGEAEKLSILAERLDIDLPAALKELKARNMSADPEKTFGLNAAGNGLTPAEFYAFLKPFRRAPAGEAPLPEGGGWGAKTVKSLSLELGLDLQTALDRLKKAGIGAKGGETLKDLAGKAGLSPRELAEIIRR
jgi:hypothetical protein